RTRERIADAQVRADARVLAEVGDAEPRLRVVALDLRRHQRAADVRVRVRGVEVVDEAAVLPVDRAALALAEEVRLVEADESADARALARRGAEVHVARALLLHAEHDVDVALLVGRTRVRERQRRLEEAEVADALPAADQSVLVEHVTRDDEQL